jgi:hypothetical protein
MGTAPAAPAEKLSQSGSVQKGSAARRRGFSATTGMALLMHVSDYRRYRVLVIADVTRFKAMPPIRKRVEPGAFALAGFRVWAGGSARAVDARLM